LSDFVHEILLWRDRFTPAEEERDEVLAVYPYLGAGHEYLEKVPEVRPISGIFTSSIPRRSSASACLWETPQASSATSLQSLRGSAVICSLQISRHMRSASTDPSLRISMPRSMHRRCDDHRNMLPRSSARENSAAFLPASRR